MSAPLEMGTGSPATAILGVGGYRPARVVTNAEVIELIDSSDEWIRERSGIVSRHRAAVHMSTTVSSAAAVSVAHRLGATGAAAFDISAACAGFCHALALASDMVRAGSAGHVLVVGCEKLSDLVDPTDRSTAFLFGDGAGAAVVGPAAQPGIGPVVWGADGGQADAITQTRPWDELRTDRAGAFPTLTMSGQQVFRWAVYQMAPVCEEAMARAGVSAADLDAFIPHQANLRIVEALAKRLGLPADLPVARDIVTTGNTSAASIPLAMERMLDTGQAPSGGTALLVGFGAGLSYAAQVVTLP